MYNWWTGEGDNSSPPSFRELLYAARNCKLAMKCCSSQLERKRCIWFKMQKRRQALNRIQNHVHRIFKRPG